MQKLTLRTRHISVTARLFGDVIGSTAVPVVKEKGGRPSNASRLQMPDDPMEAHKAVMQALFEKAKSGDVAAVRQWNELNTPQSTDPFSCEVHITPYNIQDRSLSRIAMQADTPVVLDILDGIKVRMEADGAPQLLKDTMRSAYMQLDEWMRTAYAPKDV